MARLTKDEKRLLLILAGAFRKQSTAIRELVEKIGYLGINEQFWNDQSEEMRKIVRPILQDIYIRHGYKLIQNAFSRKQDEGDFINLEAIDWSRSYSFELIKGIMSYTRELVSDALTNFISIPGYTLGDFMDEIQGTAFGLWRCELISITETTRAYSEAHETVANNYRDRGIEFEEVWHTVGESACDLCKERHGKVRGKDWYDLPPIHPGCRCGVSMRMKR
jgi:hypothetical protein